MFFQDVGWFAAAGVLSQADCQTVFKYSRQSCSELAPHVLDLMDCFGVPNWAIQAPIALDWQKYNQTDNRGEVTQQMKLW